MRRALARSLFALVAAACAPARDKPPIGPEPMPTPEVTVNGPLGVAPDQPPAAPMDDAALIRTFIDGERSSDAHLAFIRGTPGILTARAEPYGNALMWALEFAEEGPALALIAAGASDPGAVALAARGGLDGVLELLFARGASAATADYWGSALHRAAKEGHASTITLLVKHGAPVDLRADDHQSTALHEAVSGRHVDAVKALLDAKASVHARDDDGQTPLAWAGFGCRPMEIRVYRLPGNEGAPLHTTSHADPGPCAVVKLLVDAGAQVDTGDAEGNTPLITAAALGSVRGVEALLVAGANARAKNDAGETALDKAKARNDDAVVELLTGPRPTSLRSDRPAGLGPL